MLLDPTYANYEGQLAFSVPGVKIVRLRVLDPQTWSYLPETDPAGIAREFSRLFDLHRPRMVLFGAPDNPTSQVVPQALADVMLAKTSEAGAWLVIDAAYKCQYFQTPPAYYAWSPADHPNVVGIHSNSKWARGLGRRLGWIEAQQSVVEAIERVQQCSILCPDTLSQMAMATISEERDPERIAEALRGGRQRALQECRRRDAEGGRHPPAAAAPDAVRRSLHLRRHRHQRRGVRAEGAQGDRRAGRARRRLRRVAHQRRAHLVRPARERHREDRRRPGASRRLDAFASDRNGRPT